MESKSIRSTKRKNTKVWASEDVRKLIPLIEDHPCLYDVRNPSYRSKTARRNALNSIAAHFVGQFDGDDIRLKIHGLRAQFTGERSKIKSRIKSKVSADEACAMCKWEYFNSLKFMYPDFRKSLEEIQDSFNNRNDESDGNYSQSSSTPNTSNTASICTSLVNDKVLASPLSDDSLQTPPEMYAATGIKRKYDDIRMQTITKCLDIMDQRPKDDCSIFAEYIASELRFIRDNRLLYTTTKQKIINIIGEATRSFLLAESNVLMETFVEDEVSRKNDEH